jgi:hypothetical protein
MAMQIIFGSGVATGRFAMGSNKRYNWMHAREHAGSPNHVPRTADSRVSVDATK